MCVGQDMFNIWTCITLRVLASRKLVIQKFKVLFTSLKGNGEEGFGKKKGGNEINKDIERKEIFHHNCIGGGFGG